MKKEFCEPCRDMVGFTVVEMEQERVLQGKQIRFLHQTAVCTECGGSLYSPDIHDENLRRINAEF